MTKQEELRRKQLLVAIKSGDLQLFLGGRGLYNLGTNIYSPGYNLFNPPGAMSEIYKYYRDEPSCGIVEILEENILDWLTWKSGVGVYEAFVTISYQMKMEQTKLAAFKLNYEKILPEFRKAVDIYKEKLENTMWYEGRDLERSLWEEIEVENKINIKNYGINLLQ